MVYNTKVREFDKRVMFGGKSVPYKKNADFQKYIKVESLSQIDNS